MIKFNRFVSSLLVSGLMLSQVPLSHADELFRPTSYGQKVQAKALRSVTNLTTGILEFPKNIINTTNASNIFYGLVGGGFKGAVNMIGRTGAGVLDLITIPLPTKPIISPDPIWQDFDIDTSYGPIFRLDQNPPLAVQATAEPALPPPTPVVIKTPAPAPIDRSRLYNENTNQNLDKVFKHKMMK
jgi:putative exosortase-associated protein (TIGR04073 family)